MDVLATQAEAARVEVAATPTQTMIVHLRTVVEAKEVEEAQVRSQRVFQWKLNNIDNSIVSTYGLDQGKTVANYFQVEMPKDIVFYQYGLDFGGVDSRSMRRRLWSHFIKELLSQTGSEDLLDCMLRYDFAILLTL